MRGIRFALVTLLLGLCLTAPPLFASNDKVELTKAQPAMVVMADLDVKYISVFQAPEAVGSVGEVMQCHPIQYKQPSTDATMTPFRPDSLHRNDYLSNYSFCLNTRFVHQPQIE